MEVHVLIGNWCNISKLRVLFGWILWKDKVFIVVKSMVLSGWQDTANAEIVIIVLLRSLKPAGLCKVFNSFVSIIYEYM